MDIYHSLQILVFTHNRYNKLLRLLKYYKSYGFPVRIRILDSSSHEDIPDELKLLLKNNKIEYLKYPHTISAYEKALKGVQNISTVYSVMCADDDFITPIGLKECLEFLENNPDYVVAQGKIIAFKKHNQDPAALMWSLGKDCKSIDFDSPRRRFYEYLSYYYNPIFYAVYRTEIMQSVFESMYQYTSDSRFGELLTALLTVIYGKMKTLNVLYAIREDDPDSYGKKFDTIRDYFMDGSFDEKYFRFQGCLAKNLTEHDSLTLKESGKLIDRAMNNYLKKSIPYLRFISIIKRLMSRLGVLEGIRDFKDKLYPRTTVTTQYFSLTENPYHNSAHPYHLDFMRIKDILESEK